MPQASQFIKIVLGPVPVARSDVHVTGIQEIAGSIFWSGNILSWRLVIKSFLWPFSPYSLFKYGSYHYWRKDAH